MAKPVITQQNYRPLHLDRQGDERQLPVGRDGKPLQTVKARKKKDQKRADNDADDKGLGRVRQGYVDATDLDPDEQRRRKQLADLIGMFDEIPVDANVGVYLADRLSTVDEAYRNQLLVNLCKVGYYVGGALEPGQRSSKKKKQTGET